MEIKFVFNGKFYHENVWSNLSHTIKFHWGTSTIVPFYHFDFAKICYFREEFKDGKFRFFIEKNVFKLNSILSFVETTKCK